MRYWTLALALLSSTVAIAHSSGDEARKVADCEKFPGTASAGVRGECLKCVQRPKPHHFHAKETGDKRCQAD